VFGVVALVLSIPSCIKQYDEPPRGGSAQGLLSRDPHLELLIPPS